ncbi:MAG: murein L,D-transpeptidase catalytic domain family protein [Lunatimonas sp.]|uniref:murein L,D-transpeptidase catalytic domain family protein n=1 Tax=Lunatimonas sp. TaxID=2060141 RepID=UPI00263A521F|nr:murein L,D-transpeptidase catalytic domain family protein [Lunatimonas sp.]MCC5936002.1 murein L,D-transpeptidase catalytic domain family protein [Lunatimonas sp.]
MISLHYYLWPVLWLLNFGSLNTLTEIPVKVPSPTHSTYDILLNAGADVPSEDVFELAMQGWNKLQDTLSSNVLTIIDFTLPSTEKRLWIVDPVQGEILLHSVVAHGRNSGDLMADRFSNRPESYQSSLGFYRTAETYQGKHGYSLRLDGLEEGFNDQARNRAIVIHGADYASEEFAKQVGRLGRSLGCPALPTELTDRAIDLIKDGSLLFIYGRDPNYLKSSPLIHQHRLTASL